MSGKARAFFPVSTKKSRDKIKANQLGLKKTERKRKYKLHCIMYDAAIGQNGRKTEKTLSISECVMTIAHLNAVIKAFIKEGFQSLM